MVRRHTIFLFLVFIINFANAVHKEHPDFRQYEKVERYKNEEKDYDRKEFGEMKNCPCGRVQLNNMALVYLDRINGQEMKEPQRYLVSLKTMGMGGFSKVYHAIPWIEKGKPGKCVALKIPKATADDPKNGIKQLEQEAIKLDELSSNPNNQHIIKLHEILSYEDRKGKEKFALVLESGEMSLDKYFEKMEKLDILDEVKFLFIIKQMLMGLKEVHKAGYIYFDVKPENMLIMPYPPPRTNQKRDIDEVYVKYIDFAGIVKIPPLVGAVRRGDQKISCTDKFEPPEMYNSNGNPEVMLTQAFDIWSLGVSIISLLAQTHVFMGQLDDAVYKEAYKKTPNEERISSLTEKRDKVIMVMAREVIANQMAATYPRIADLLAKLKKDFPESMEIVAECLQTKPASRLKAEKLLEKGMLKVDVDIDVIYKMYNNSGDSTGETSGTASASSEAILKKIRANIANRLAEAQKGSNAATSVAASPSAEGGDQQQTHHQQQWKDKSPAIGTAASERRRSLPTASAKSAVGGSGKSTQTAKKEKKNGGKHKRG